MMLALLIGKQGDFQSFVSHSYCWGIVYEWMGLS